MASASFDIQGKLYAIMDEQAVTDKFRKREFVLELPDGSYSQYPKFQLTQDKCDLLNSFSVGNEVKVTFNLTGKPFVKGGETMYFTNLQAWRIENVATGTPSYYQTAPAETSSAPSFYSNNDEGDDLPF
jgi:single-strand DNA-binding protein